jgi:hypothetical protein
MHESKPVAFRNPTANDVLELAIGTGPCSVATLTIIVRHAESGQILYSYVERFEQHTVPAEDRDLLAEAKTFIAGELQTAMGKASELPPWLEPEAYEQEHQGSIMIEKAQYEALRATEQPLLSHPTYYEGWRMVVFDEKTGEAITVVEGGT